VISIQSNNRISKITVGGVVCPKMRQAASAILTELPGRDKIGVRMHLRAHQQGGRLVLPYLYGTSH